MEKAGIIGGAGYTGSFITKKFLEENYAVKVSVSNLSIKESFRHLKNLPNASNLEIRELDILDTESIEQFVTWSDILIHCGCPFQYEFEDPQTEIFEPIVNGTENFLNAIKNNSTVKKVIMILSTAAYNTSFPFPAANKNPDHVYTEKDSPYMHEDNHPYAQAMFYADQIVREFISAKPTYSFEIVSLFPTFAVGKSLPGSADFTSVQIQSHFKNKITLNPFMEKLFEENVEFALVDVKAIAKAVFKAANVKGIHGKNYFLNSESWKVSDISRMLNHQKPVGKPRLGYSNRLAVKDLHMSFEPVKKTLHQFEAG